MLVLVTSLKLQGEAIDTRSAFKKVILIELSYVGDGLWQLDAPGHDNCVFKAPYSFPDTTKFNEVSLKLWDIQTHGLDCGEMVAKWVSKVLGGDLLMIQHPPHEISARKARGKYLKTYPRTFPVSCVPTFSDVTPYMFTTHPSLQDLRTRLPVHVALHVSQVNFRPNIVINGDNLQPWDEDRWVGEVRVGNTVFSYNKTCTRCLLTTVNDH